MVLKNKSAVITGGASGIGFATAQELLKAGASKILILDLPAALSDDLKKQLADCNSEATVIYTRCDITNKTELEKILREDSIQWLGSLDILVACAGIYNESNPARCVDVNLLGLINCNLIAIDLMSKAKSGHGGHIVNISSVAGLEPFPIAAVYTATKFGVTGFTRSVGDDAVFNHTGVKVMAICPGATDTSIYRSVDTASATFPWLQEAAKEIFTKYTPQNPSAVGKAVVQIINEGDTGAVWISDAERVIPVQSTPNNYL